MLAWILLAITVALTAASQVFQKQVAIAFHAPGNTQSSTLLFYMRNIRFWIALALLGLGLLSWLGVLTLLPVGKAYPLLAANYVIVLLLSRWIFAEQIPPTRWLGVAVIITALVLIAGS